ncbi:MAG: hypothetical protein CMJ64_00065 [Planctomycetaceae bacterium]|nr:hypothetical protein [Planctomycetaceae bacterium]
MERLGALVRYDTLEHRNDPFGDQSLYRFTYGLNVGIPGGSRVAINHERWVFDNGTDADVLGLRWTATF